MKKWIVGLWALSACGPSGESAADGGGETDDGGVNVDGGDTAVAGEDGTGTAGDDADGDGDGDGKSTSAGDGSATTSASSGGDAGDDGSTSGDSTETSAGDDQGTTSGAEGSGTTMDCPSAEVAFEPVIPTVVFLIDQSGSMTQNFQGEDRWDVVRDSLTDPATGVIASLQSSVRFGLALYDGNNNNCPDITSVAPALDNLDPITMVYDDESPDGDTPTGDAIDALVETMQMDMTPGPKVIVLATDGEPDTCAQPNPQNGQDEAVAAAEAAYAAGISLFIMSVGNDVSDGHLQDMANAGVGWQMGDPDATFYRPADQDAMVADFENIINGFRSCVFTLDGQIVEGQESQGTVTVNGEEVPYQDPNGWDVNNPSEIELFGEACEAIQEGEVEVSIEFPCDAVVPQ